MSRSGAPRRDHNGAVLDPDIAAHYNLALEESRLAPDGKPRLEYLRTLELLERLLPSPPARVLDVGGGTGVYAIELGRRGYAVDLVDPIALHVERATELARFAGATLVTASLGDARDLGPTRAGYDAVLLMGPLYHLVDGVDRMRAFREAVRVARPGAVVIATAISRFASLYDGLKRRLLDDPTFRSIVERDLADGQHRNSDVVNQPDFFTTAYFHLPDDLEREAIDSGLRDVQLFSIEGPAWILEDANDVANQLFAARATESQRALMGATSHLLVAGTTA